METTSKGTLRKYRIDVIFWTVERDLLGKESHEIEAMGAGSADKIARILVASHCPLASECRVCYELFEREEVEAPEDDIDVHELLARLAKKARGLGWDIPKLQDQVFAYFDSLPPAAIEK